jgi:putative Mg2+ transporter-C (MgtC) family protein
MDNLSTQLWPVIGVAFAMVLGGAVGYERELKNRPAGFRTHMLVAGAATFLVELGELLLFDTHYRSLPGINVDPLRLVEAVVSGVAFIGAGTIFATRNGETVGGITTAASLLMVSIVGVAVGFGYWLLALAITVLTLLVLTMLNLVEGKPSLDKGEGGSRPAGDEARKAPKSS